MKKITIVTFVSKNESVNPDFVDFVKYCKNFFDVETFMFCEKSLPIAGINMIELSKTTKYKRILFALNNCKYNNILCVDNDIILNKEEVITFLNKVLDKDYGLAWGKIRTQKSKGVIAKLIELDKKLSHNHIRPFLWNFNVGISLPGQIFLINGVKFKGILPRIDTVYDDLIIGITARQYKVPYIFVKSVLGYERPNVTFKGLLRQRIRWSKGLAETIIHSIKEKTFKYVLIHAICFNLLWVPLYLMLFLLFKWKPIISIGLYLLLLYFLSDYKLNDIPYALIYSLTFPIIYIVWFCSLIYNLIKIYLCGGKNG